MDSSKDSNEWTVIKTVMNGPEIQFTRVSHYGRVTTKYQAFGRAGGAAGRNWQEYIRAGCKVSLLE